ncbi:MAG: adenosylcobinamide-GDP ribazoletransferase [Lachnospiraceae bacterium]|nr:adenosylcobinamide-GDP ribazoletransferase [Lachnospiraceae bacterium]
MKMIKKILAAFSLYSRIPVPHSWAGDDIEGAITPLPLVGVLIAVVMFGLAYLLDLLKCPVFAGAVIVTAVPLLVTGGFHADGFMDTADALRSYADREKKLEILKDPHIGAFAVTGLVTAVMLMVFSTGLVMYMQLLWDIPVILFLGAVFVISRAMAALTSVYIINAKEDGMITAEKSGIKTGDVIVLACFVIIPLALMAYYFVIYAIAQIISFALVTVIYKRMVMKNFGGVTGDTAGYYIVMSEIVTGVMLSLAMLVFPMGGL